MKKEFFTNQLCRFEGPITQILSLMPEDKLDWNPTENTMTTRAVVQHLVDGVEDHARSMVSGEWVPKPADLEGGSGKTKDQLLDEVKQAFANAREAMQALSQEDFETVQVKIEAGAITLEGTTEEIGVSLALVHLANHTMQLFWYLRQAGVDADSGTLYFGMPPGQFSTRMQPQTQAAS